MPMSAARTKYLHLFVLALATVFAAIELWLTIRERSLLDSSNATSTTHRLDYLIACSGWTIGWSILLILISLVITAEHLGLKVFFLIYFFITAIIWLVGAIMWHIEVKHNGCDMGHNECKHNNSIQGIAWAELLKHAVGTLVFGLKIFRGNSQKQVDDGYNEKPGNGYNGQQGQVGNGYGMQQGRMGNGYNGQQSQMDNASYA
ncbi:hypothetical protein FRB95_005377 [Tulasnella sp. JGI-2019a]|nr:hypothetical protein FRB95_005377 [Tulasnella sp. JGI-2019a]